jgi:2-oxoglutarate/2-oxoacid ferredoxin oxidoreductase subunit alpha
MNVPAAQIVLSYAPMELLQFTGKKSKFDPKILFNVIMAELKLMKGNEAFAEAAIRAGVDAYFGYPITPQSEVLEYFMAEKPHERTGMVVLQAESEVAAINMVYGAASTGKKAMTSSSSPGVSLKMEGISYMAGAELPGLILNVVRGGPGLGTIQPSQADYFQATKGGGHGDYRLIVLAPSSVQEMYDFVSLSFDLTFKYRNPVMMLADGVIGQMMEKITLSDPVPRRTDEELIRECPWATTGKPKTRERNIITSLNLDSAVQEKHNIHLQEKYRTIEENEIRFEKFQCEDAEYLYVAYGSSARITQKAVQLARAKGIKAGLLRLITLFPFPKKEIETLAGQVKGMLAIEMSAGQMVEDVRLAVAGKVPVDHFGRMGGMVPSPEEVVTALEKRFIGG